MGCRGLACQTRFTSLSLRFTDLPPGEAHFVVGAWHAKPVLPPREAQYMALSSISENLEWRPAATTTYRYNMLSSPNSVQ